MGRHFTIKPLFLWYHKLIFFYITKSILWYNILWYQKISVIVQKIDLLMSQTWYFYIIKLISWYRKFWRILWYHKIAFVMSKYVEFSTDEIMTPMQKKKNKKKNAGVFPIPADTKFRAFMVAMIWYHKINFWLHKIDFLTWQIRFFYFTKSILWYKKSQKFCDIKNLLCDITKPILW